MLQVASILVIKHILVNEIYVDTFYLHELGKDTYCGLIRNIESYLKVNFEVLNRWAYPLVIDNIDMSNKLKINLKQIAFSIYSDKDTNFENYHKANLVSEVVILNKENRVGKESRLQKCILCNDVKVGKNCYLYNCIICKGAEIQNNVIIKNSIIGEKCQIKRNLKIISSVLGKNIIQEKDSFQERIFYENSEEGKENKVLTVLNRDLFLKNLEDYDLLFISNNSTLYDFNNENVLDDLKNEIEENMIRSKSKKELNKVKCNYDEDEFLEDESISSESSESSEKEEEENYSDDITNILSSGIDNKSNIDDLIKEVGSLKSTYWNHTYEETIKICLSVIITKFLNGQKFSRQHINKIGEVFKSWKNIFTRFVPNKDVELHLDTDYIKYRGYNENDEYVVVSFDYTDESYEYDEVMFLLEDMFDCYPDNFEYTDSDGNTYNYFANGKQFYIYKNGKRIGAAKTNTENAFVAISGLFGIRA
jgi:hypothetical protein